MAKTADEFLTELEQRDLAPAEIIASLRRQIASSSKPVAAASLAKLLTDKGHLTAAQAQKLLGGAAPATTGAKPPAKPAATPAGPIDGLMPLDDELVPIEPAGSLAPLDDSGLTPLEQIPAPAPAPKPAAAKPSPKPAATAKPAPKPQPAKPADDLVPLEGLAPIDGFSSFDDLTQPAASVAAPASAAAPVDLLSAPNLAGPQAALPAAATPAPQAQPAKKKSSLGLVLGLLAVLLVAGGGAAAFFLIPRGTGNAEFDLAAADYQAKSYDAAIAKLDEALTKYPASPRAPLARVQRGAAKVLAARAQSPRNWQPVLAAAKESLPPLGGEAELSQVHAEIAPLLSEMAVSLAGSAKSTEELTAAREALALADDGRFVPGSIRDWQKLQAAADSLARRDYDAAAASARDAAAAAIQKAIDAGDVAAAFAERDKLHTAHPELLTDPKLTSLGPALAAAAVAKSQPVEYVVKGETTESRGTIIGQFALAAPAAAGQAKMAIAGGNAWGIDASGAVVWRRPIGSGPTAVSVPTDSGTLLVDAFRNELLSVDPTSGKLHWRHSLPGPTAGPPVALGSRVFVTTKEGQVLAVDAATGDGIAQVQLPQSASVGPAPAGEFLVQLADDALVYLLSSADLQCLSAAYLGHEPASVVDAPVKGAKHVIVAVPRWPAATTLRPIVVTPAGKFAEIAPASEVAGLLARPLTTESGKLVVITDQGKATTFESAVDPAEGLKLLGTIDVPAAPEEASPNVSIVGIVPGSSANTLIAIAATGAASEFKLSELTGFVARQLSPAAKDAPPDVAIASVLSLAGGSALLVPAGQPAELRYLAAGATAATSVPLPGPLAAPPLAWKDGIAVACTSGTIAWLDPTTGVLKADPLQINLLPGQRLTTCHLVAGGKGDGELFVAHSGGAILRVGLATDPLPQLVELGAAKIESPITGLVASDEAVGVLDRRGRWHAFAVPDLSPAPAATLAGRSFAAGPTRIGSVVLVATDSDELVALNDQLAAAWKTPLAHGPLAGVPVTTENGALVATKSGWLSRIALDSGNEVAAVSLDQPLSAGPLIAGQFAVVIASDGTLLSVPLAALEAKQ